MKVVFMGTPDFAVYSLKALLEEHEVLAVITQPDKPKGRGNKMLFPPVKEFALEKGLAVYQPQRARDPEFLAYLKEWNPDVIAVTAFGQILPESILELPKYGCINVHGSLLPKYRGAAPMQWSLIHGEERTGITTMYMAKGMDTGDMLLKTEIPILPADNFVALHDKMAEAGAYLLLETLRALEAGTLSRTVQNEEEATYAPMISKETGHIDWNKTAKEVIDLMRGLDPSPGAFMLYENEVLKVFKGEKVDGDFLRAQNGEIVEVGKKDFTVKCADGALKVLEVQARGGKRMLTDAYLRGHEVKKGVLLK